MGTAETAVLLSPKATARRLGFSVVTLWRWRRDGVGPRFVKVGAVVRYSIEELNAFVQAGGAR